jgi:hypothetical protein
MFDGLRLLSLIIAVFVLGRVWKSGAVPYSENALTVEEVFGGRLNPLLTYSTLICLLLTVVRQNVRVRQMRDIVELTQHTRDAMVQQLRQEHLSARVVTLNACLHSRRSRIIADWEAAPHPGGPTQTHAGASTVESSVHGRSWYPGMFDEACDDDIRAIETLSKARHAFVRLLCLAETRHGPQTLVVAWFVASSSRRGQPPFNLFELRNVDVAVSDDLLCCMDALRWGGLELHDLVHDGERRVRAVIEAWMSTNSSVTYA